MLLSGLEITKSEKNGFLFLHLVTSVFGVPTPTYPSIQFLYVSVTYLAIFYIFLVAKIPNQVSECYSSNKYCLCSQSLI